MMRLAVGVCIWRRLARKTVLSGSAHCLEGPTEPAFCKSLFVAFCRFLRGFGSDRASDAALGSTLYTPEVIT